MAGEDREKLVAFIRAAKKEGAGDEFLVALLKQNGWSERRAYSAFSDYYREVVGSPVPSRGQSGEYARDAFLYLVAFATLAFWSVALIWLWNIVIQRAFPSPTDLQSSVSLRYDLAGQLASIIVAFPIFILVSRMILTETRRRPEALDSGVRKWLTYIALVIAAIALLADAVLFLSNFLTGELTVRFALQYTVLFIVAGGIFWYYLGSVGGGDSRTHDAAFGWVATAAVLAAIVIGFTGVGTPGYERAFSIDAKRVDNLHEIAEHISDRGSLPQTLSMLPVDSSVLRDPVTRVPYDYIRLDTRSYRLCATFDGQDSEPNYGFWSHPAGHHCFSFNAASAPMDAPPDYHY